MESIGERSLGPVRVDLGRTKSSDWPSPQKVAIVLFPILGVVAMISAVIFIVRMLHSVGRHESGQTIGAVITWGLGGLFFLVGMLFVCGGFLMLSFMLTMTVKIHESGLVVVRRWFRTLQVTWSDVAAIAPPELGDSSHACRLLLRSGRTEIIERLSLPSTRDHTGQLVPHTDVRIVIDHFLAWQRTNGVR
jgi:nitrate reductase NapE component